MSLDCTNISIKDRLRLSSVKRWHMLDTTRVQTVADHSYGVAVIAREIWSAIPDAVGGSGSCTLAVVLCMALDHDVEEIFTGDCHNPRKLDVDEFAEKFKRCWISSDLSRRIVKLADLVEARQTIMQIGADGYAINIKWSYCRCIGWAVDHFCDGLKLHPATDEAVIKALKGIVYTEFERDCSYSMKF